MTLTGNTGGPQPPIANNFNILGQEGFLFAGSPGNLLLTETEGTTTTAGAVNNSLLTIPLGATPGTYFFDMRYTFFDAADALGGGGSVLISAITNGVTARLIGGDITPVEDAGFTNPLVQVSANLNTIVLQANGTAGKTIDWKASTIWTFVS